LESVADDILLAKGYEVNMISASPFIPSNQTPFWNKPYGDFNLTLNTMAAMRLIFPKALIPSVSALEKLETQGQLKGFNAGANVITINYTPLKHRKNYVIYTTDRKIVSFEHAKKTIDKAGLKFSI